MSPLRWFKCPEGSKNPIVEVGDCLCAPSDSCPNGDRCMSLATLNIIAQEREWAGVPSTTQLISGTMCEFLKLTRDFAVDPQSRAWILIGLAHHKKLEDIADQLGITSELALSVDRDIIDSLEPTSSGWTLLDYKTWGSFRVAKALGIVQTGKKPDPSGAVYKTSGRWGKAGDPKMVPVFRQMPQQADNLEVELQMNNYRVKLKDIGIDINKMECQITVRDGSLASAKSRGVMKNIYKIAVKELPDKEIREYFARKQAALLDALTAYKLDSNFAPAPCNNVETWEGNKCSGYCDVAMYCPKGMSISRQEEL